jgi:type I restriction enzyme S subunit
LLLCITGALTGNVVLVDVDLPNAFVNQHVALIRPKADKAFPRFLAYALHSGMGQAQFRTSEYGGTKQGLGLGDVKSVVAALPPLREQEVIARHLDGVLADLTAPIAQAQREIELIREYRTRLIVELVTGQLDVRAAANNLPPEVQASESVIAPEAVDETEELQEAVADDE